MDRHGSGASSLGFFIFAFSTLTLAGCSTYNTWNDKQKRIEVISYSEKISSVLISQDGKKLVVASQDHHYIFDAPKIIVATLGSTFQNATVGEFGTFHVGEGDSITGAYTLRLRPGLTEENKAAAIAAGFNAESDGGLKYEGWITGTRYVAGNIRIPSSKYALNKTYDIDVEVYRVKDELSVPAKILLTPLTVTFDGVVTIGHIVLMPIAVLLNASCSAVGKKC